MTRTARRSLVALVSLLALLAIAYSIYWVFAARWFERSIADWIQQRRAEGYRIEGAIAPIGGFPFRLATAAAKPLIEAPGGVWRWQSERVEAHSRPWAPFDVQIRPLGAQEAALDGKVYALTAKDAEIGLDFSLGGRFEGAWLEAEDVTGAEKDAEPARIGRVAIEIDRAEPAADTVEPIAFGFRIETTDLALPAALNPALGREIAAAAAIGRFAGPIVPAALPDALRGWRDAGGAVELDRFTLAWGPLSISGNATVALDDRLQPLIAASTEIAGIGETFDALTAAGAIDSQHGPLGKQLLLGMAGADGKLALPITLQDGFLFVGPLKLLPVAPIDWERF